MNILITGVAGFIGFSLANNLLKENDKIKVYGLDNYDDYYSKKFALNDIEAFKKIGERKLVAGQEDLIFNVLYNLKNEKKK